MDQTINIKIIFEQECSLSELFDFVYYELPLDINDDYVPSKDEILYYINEEIDDIYVARSLIFCKSFLDYSKCNVKDILIKHLDEFYNFIKKKIANG